MCLAGGADRRLVIVGGKSDMPARSHREANIAPPFGRRTGCGPVWPGVRSSLAIRLLLAAILAGLAARVVRFGLDLQIYHDEAYLLNNVLVKSYGDLLGPLANAQAAPPAFSWALKWTGQWSDRDWAVRLVPLMAGLASLGLFASLCGRVLRGSAAWFALAVFAASHVVITATVRAKPYAVDMFVGALFAWLATRWIGSRRGRAWPLAVMAVAAPAAVWFSYTSVFVIGGVGGVLAAYQFAGRRRLPGRSWLALGAVGLLALVSFGGLYVVHLEPALAGAGDSGLRAFWSDAFPPLDSVPRTLWWLVTTHTGRLYAYPVGERTFGSTLSFILWVAGVAAVWRVRNGRWIVAVLLAPQVLLLAAAFAGKYPYGGHARISLFLAPAMCLFIGVGIASLTARLTAVHRHRVRAIAAGVLLAVPIGEMLGDVVAVARASVHPPVAEVLARVDADAGVRDRIVCVNDIRLLGGGGPSRQTFEYYMQRKLGGRVEWSWRPADAIGSATQPATAPGDLPAEARGDLFVIAYVEPSDDASLARVDALRRALGDRLVRLPHTPCRIISRRSGELHVWRIARTLGSTHLAASFTGGRASCMSGASRGILPAALSPRRMQTHLKYLRGGS